MREDLTAMRAVQLAEAGEPAGTVCSAYPYAQMLSSPYPEPPCADGRDGAYG
jgi:hypothetical protein